MAKKKKSAKRNAKKPEKKSTPKKAGKKPAAKKKGATLGVSGTPPHGPGRPICTSTHGYLGNCMPWNQADAIARQHESDSPDCSVSVESC